MKNTQRHTKVKQRNGFLSRGLLSVLLTVSLPIASYSQTTQTQVSEEWTVATGSQNSFQRSVVRTATLGGQVYTFVAGATVNANGDYDMLVEKFWPGGGLMWAQTYDYSGGDDAATDVRIAPNGEVYICGAYYKDATDSSNAIVIKYDPNGNQRWVKTYNGSGSRNDGFASLMVSGASVVAVGTTWAGASQYNMLTMRMDTASNSVWTTTYDNSGLLDGAISLTTRSGSIFVTGASQTATTTYKIATWKINPANGAITQTTLSSGTAFGIDKVTDIQEDASGNVYICGGVLNVSTGYDYKIIKYDPNLAVLWSASYTGAGMLDDVATGLYIDSLDNVIVTGYTNTTTQGRNYATIKYNSSGTQQWVASYNGAANGNDSATAIVTKGTDIYVTGITYNGGNYDYMTIKYNASGTKLWEIPWNSTPNKPDIATAIAIDTAGAVVVTGQTKIPGATSYVTIKYWQGTVIVPPDTVAAGPRNFEFTENRGQLRNLSYTSDFKTQYYNQATTPQVYFQDGSKLSWLLTKIDTVVSTTDSIVQVDMYFANANSVKAYGINPGEDHAAYYLDHLATPAVRIQNYNQVVYPEIYSGIDFESGNHEGGVKYSFIVKPGANVSDIDFYFGGATSVAMNGNDVRISTPLGNIDLPQASAFQIDGSGNFVSLGWQPTYTISSGHVSYTGLGSYDPTKPLVFVFHLGSKNPTSAANGNLEFCSYGGTPSDDYFYDACAVVLGEVAVGFSMQNGFPGFPGNFGGSYGGGQDGIIVFYETDLLQFRCYVGGAGFDVVNAVTLNGNITTNNRVFFAGGTNGSITATTPSGPPGAYVQSLSGNNDAMFGDMYVDNNLQMEWFTYFGGSTGYETVNDIFWDAGNLYFTGEGVSTTPLVTETGASNYSTGKTLIGKFDSNDSLVWSTRFGSGAGNSIYRRNNALVVAGKISSTQTDLPINTPAGFPYVVSSGAGSMDAFIARFDGADNCTWSTYYGGSSSDVAEGCAIDENNDIYVCGSTGSSNFPLAWQGTGNGYMDSTLWGGDAFMLKFNSGGGRYWASLHGGQFSETFYDVVIDTLNNAYFLGTTGSHNMPAYHGGTTLYNQTTIGDNLLNSAYGDGMILMVNSALDKKWITYFGGNKADGIYGGSINPQYPNKLIACGGAMSDQNFPWYGTNAISTNAGINTFDAWEGRFDLTNINIVGFQDQQPVSNEMVVYPSPGDGNVTVQVSTPEQPLSIEVYNAVGQLVYFVNAPEFDASGRLNLDLTMLGEGIYFLNLQYADKVQSEKFSIVR